MCEHNYIEFIWCTIQNWIQSKIWMRPVPATRDLFPWERLGSLIPACERQVCLCRRFGQSALTFFRAKMKLEWNTCHYIALHRIKCCHWICQLAPQAFGWIHFLCSSVQWYNSVARCFDPKVCQLLTRSWCCDLLSVCWLNVWGSQLVMCCGNMDKLEFE